MIADAALWEPTVDSRNWKYVVLHHSGSVEGNVSSIDDAYRQRRDQFGTPWPGIGYHFVVGNGLGMADGRIEPTFRWQQQLHGAHTASRPHNLHGIGVCLVGDFEVGPPTSRQVAGVERLLEWLCGRYGISRRRVIRHADVAATRCPGRLFPFAELLDSIREPVALAAGVHQPSLI